MRKVKLNVKTITTISILVSLGVILSYVDKIISSAAFPFLPTAKIGLANIVIVIGIYSFSFRESILMVILKSTLVSMLFGSVTSFVIGGTASFMSFITMYIAYKTIKDIGSMVSVSVIGGFVHIVTQLIVVATIYRLGEVVLYYGALMIITSLITSILIGLIANKLSTYNYK